MEISYEQLDDIGKLADKADNFLVYADSSHPFAANISISTRFDALKHGLTELRDEIKAMVVKVGGEDPWGDSQAEEEL